MSGLEWTPDVSIYRQPWRESTGACLQAPAGEGITMAESGPDWVSDAERQIESAGRLIAGWLERDGEYAGYYYYDDAASVDPGEPAAQR